MTTQEGNNAVVARHLEALATAAKEYTLAELANISVSGESYTLPTASETLKGGVKIGSGLQMDGDTLNVTIQSGSAGGTVLDTVPATVDGGFWYEVTNDVPAIWLRKGNYGFRYSHDKIRFVGTVDDTLVAYLPFDVSTTVDACGNEWTATGDVSLDTEIKKFGTSSVHLPQGTCLSAPMPLDINIDKWTFDAWAYLIKGGILFSLGASAINSATGIRVDNNMFDVPNSNNSWAFTDGYTALALNEWHHIAIVKNGTSLRLFIDGTLTLDKTLANTMYDGGFFLLGTTYGNGGYQPNFYVDNVRLFKGVALWTSDFTPPTANDYA